jgi:hypothetical protein
MRRGPVILEPGGLYITISIPPRVAANRSLAEHYFNYLPDELDLDSYETCCAEGQGTEEFDWGLYWHRDTGDGVWFVLRPVEQPVLQGPVYPQRPVFRLDARRMTTSPRLANYFVGLVRVLKIPPERHTWMDEMGRYLWWLTAHTAPEATRSFIWASSVHLRARRHIAEMAMAETGSAMAAAAMEPWFDVTTFLREALGFAYGEVWYALAGQLPRPVMISQSGIDMTPLAR